MLRAGLRWAALAALGVQVTSCGGGDEGPPAPETPPGGALDRAFDRLPTSGVAQIDFGTVIADVSLEEPVTAQLEGPFVAGDGTTIPNFDLDFEAEARGFGVDGELVSTGDDAYVVFFGENYRVGQDRVAQANRRIKVLAAQTGERGLRALGIDVRSWFRDARYDGTDEVEGVACHRIRARLRLKEFLDDIEQAGAALGFDPAVVRDAVGRPSFGESIEACVGVNDGLLRRLGVDANAPTFELLLSDIGEPQTIEPPPGGGFQPIDDLLDRLPGI